MESNLCMDSMCESQSAMAMMISLLTLSTENRRHPSSSRCHHLSHSLYMRMCVRCACAYVCLLPEEEEVGNGREAYIPLFAKYSLSACFFTRINSFLPSLAETGTHRETEMAPFSSFHLCLLIDLLPYLLPCHRHRHRTCINGATTASASCLQE